ncbi:hypothetical protein V2I01_34450 [Micromonospora sp. BRA006-A]|nr:hypothetical protein [Micromonospora sp. BRA006-A]
MLTLLTGLAPPLISWVESLRARRDRAAEAAREPQVVPRTVTEGGVPC